MLANFYQPGSQFREFSFPPVDLPGATRERDFGLNSDSITAVRNSRVRNSLVVPLYDSYCFSGICGTIEQLLLGETSHRALPNSVMTELKTYDKVVTLFVDAYGWEAFNRDKDDLPLWRHALTRGRVSVLTSQCPSNTAAHVPTIHTGQTVFEHGIAEWMHYHEKVDAIIKPILFSFAGASPINALEAAGFTHKDIFPVRTFYEHLRERKIRSTLFQFGGYAPSPFSDAFSKGADLRTYRATGTTGPFPEQRDLEVGLQDLKKIVQSRGAGNFHFYTDVYDLACHKHGPGSDAAAQSGRQMIESITKLFVEPLFGKCGDTALFIVADHGQMDIDAIWYVNEEAPAINRYLKKNKKGERIIFSGSPRDIFLHIEDEKLAEAKAYLSEQLQHRALVFTSDELISMGMFGSQRPTGSFITRLGNLAVFPIDRQATYWRELPDYHWSGKGHHGGLSSQEMEVPFIFLPLS